MDAASMTLTAGDYLLYTALGVCVVFFALILLMVIIKVLVALTEEKPAKAAASADSAESVAPIAPAKPAKPAPGSAGEFKLYDTDPRDAAMVMAIVADELGKPLNELRFISIREVK